MLPAGNAVFCNGSNPTITNCRIEGNSTGQGAIYLFNSSPNIIGCTITGNSTDYDGAGIYCGWSCNPTVSDCLITGNSADHGGGIFCWLASPLISNCTFAGNQAEHYGAAVLCNGGSPDINHCTITGNRATEAGGALYCQGSKPTISNSILWSNHAADGPELFLTSNGSGPSNLTASYSNIQGGQTQVSLDMDSSLFWDPGNIETDPCFVDDGYWDSNSTPEDANDDIWVSGEYHLQSQVGRWEPNQGQWVTDTNTSRCIDAGNPGCVVAEEFEEPNNIRINMGAYGGTAEASKAPTGWSLLADLTNDGISDFQDLTYFAGSWQKTASQQPGDLNRDGTVNWPDAVLLVDDWLRQTIWYEW
jgi:predicted outer membrane repeat protein